MQSSPPESILHLFLQGSSNWHWSANSVDHEQLLAMKKMDAWKQCVGRQIVECKEVGALRSVLWTQIHTLETEYSSYFKEGHSTAHAWYWWVKDQKKVLLQLLHYLGSESKGVLKHRMSFEYAGDKHRLDDLFCKENNSLDCNVPFFGEQSETQQYENVLKKIHILQKRFGLKHFGMSCNINPEKNSIENANHDLECLEIAMERAKVHYQIKSKDFCLGKNISIQMKGVDYLECTEGTQAFFHPSAQRLYQSDIQDKILLGSDSSVLTLGVDAKNLENHVQHEWMHYLDHVLFLKVFDAIEKHLSVNVSKGLRRKVRKLLAQGKVQKVQALLKETMPYYWERVCAFALEQNVDMGSALELLHCERYAKKYYLYEGTAVYSQLPKALRSILKDVHPSFNELWATIQGGCTERSFHVIWSQSMLQKKKLVEGLLKKLHLGALSGQEQALVEDALNQWLVCLYGSSFWDLSNALHQESDSNEFFIKIYDLVQDRSVLVERAFCNLYKVCSLVQKGLCYSRTKLSDCLTAGLVANRMEALSYWSVFSLDESLPFCARSEFVQKAKGLAVVQKSIYWILPAEVIARSVTNNAHAVEECGIEVNLNMLSDEQLFKVKGYIKRWVTGLRDEHKSSVDI